LGITGPPNILAGLCLSTFVGSEVIDADEDGARLL